MRIALAQLNFTIGDFAGNLARMQEAVRQARAGGAHLVIFPELAVCGYPPTDMLFFDVFVRECERALHELQHMSKDIAIIVGAPTRTPVRYPYLHNSALVFEGGQRLAVVHKKLLPTYDVFDEWRYFVPGSQKAQVVRVAGMRLAVTVCEDIWTAGTGDITYTIDPVEELRLAGNVDLLVNISGSPFSVGHFPQRREVLARAAGRLGCPAVYVNTVGAQTDLIFDGGSMAVLAEGRLAGRARFFEEELLMVEVGGGGELWCGGICEDRQIPEEELLFEALRLGIADFVRKQKLKGCVVGLSGGVDSSLTAALAVSAVGRECVFTVFMPSQFTAERSRADANEVAQRLGTQLLTIPISDSYQMVVEQLRACWGDLPFDVTEENIQARLRMVILMALANKYSLIVLNTSNKSELATGYGTLYGDISGALGVLGDVYKTQVYKVAHYANKVMNPPPIPTSVLERTPTAELRPNQTDQDTLPPYEVLDRILKLYIEEQKGANEIVAQTGTDPLLVESVLHMVNANEFKRHQAPPLLRVSAKCLSVGRHMPIVANYEALEKASPAGASAIHTSS